VVSSADVATGSFKVRIGSQEFPIDEDFTVGRSSSCDLVLADTLVSRRHAAFLASPAGLVVQDLGSRNGVLLNGVRVDGTAPLKHGDRVTIGGVQLTVVETRRARMKTISGNEPTSMDRITAPPPTVVSEYSSDDVEFDATAKGTVFEMFSKACDRALGDGDLDGAESATRILFMSVRAALLRGASVGVVLERATGYGLSLAERTGQQVWIERVFELYSANKRVLREDHIDRIVAVIAGSPLRNPQPLDHYLGKLDEREDLTDELSSRIGRLRSLLDTPANPETT